MLAGRPSGGLEWITGGLRMPFDALSLGRRSRRMDRQPDACGVTPSLGTQILTWLHPLQYGM